ncbi:MAG: flagellar hook protein FlgE [Clostridiaceae bacterium]|jgi:flagellar hook protein FlgE|nr:flagellar hook protein FlgE [Clostridiaceae bacterium]
MMRSMFSSVSGLRSHQTKMDVIGNNIANVNTVGYKASRTSFAEIFAQTLSGAGSPDPNTGKGGTNPMQIGLGMNVSAVDTLMGRGSLQRTDNITDLSIEGEGFFIVRAGLEGTPMFTRAGNFSIDKLGNLVTSQGLNLLGWQKYEMDDEGNYIFDTQEEIKPLNLYEDEYNLNKRIIAAKVTTKAVLAGNLDATVTPVGGYTGNPVNGGDIDQIPDTRDAAGNPVTGGDGIPDDGSRNIDPHFIVPLTVYDALGNEYKLNVRFWKNFTETTSDTPPVTTTSWYYQVTGSNATASNATGYIKFDSEGRIITNDPDSTFNVRPIITLDPDNSVGADAFDFELNFEKLSMFADDSSVKPTQVDGYPPGTLTSFSIGSDGIITGVYSNGRQQPLGMVALAVFDNAAGLQKAGSNLFLPTSNSGDFNRAFKPGTEGAGSLNPGTLEMSNVDLAQQFTEMIVTQRGFQANSRVMTTADEILQELTNLKR